MTGNSHLWLVVFKDDPAMLEVRAEFGQEHLSYVDRNSDKILLAGGLRYGPETPFVGGSWLVTAQNITEVEKLIHDDPYFDAIHRKYDISFWGVFHNTINEGILAA